MMEKQPKYFIYEQKRQRILVNFTYIPKSITDFLGSQETCGIQLSHFYREIFAFLDHHFKRVMQKGLSQIKDKRDQKTIPTEELLKMVENETIEVVKLFRI